MNLKLNFCKTGLLVVLALLLPGACRTAKPAVDLTQKPIPSLEETSPFEKYLIGLDEYTSQGKVYHEKYHAELRVLARVLVEKYNNKFEVAEKSIGFYYDKRTNAKDRLYLGADLKFGKHPASALNYNSDAMYLLENYLPGLLNNKSYPMHVFSENEVIGVVVGFGWIDGYGSRQSINIWMPKEDLGKYLREEISLQELIRASITTNTDSKVIKLAEL